MLYYSLSTKEAFLRRRSVKCMELHSCIYSNYRRTNEGYTYLHLASKTGQSTVFEMVFECEENKNATSNKGETPFHLACKHGHSTIADILINVSVVLEFLTIQ